ncbi:MAG TPA: hypothetical protein VM870_08270, partial [Pyrinomonadaceae bacterium]|nr:hypothetical protein [Pyrinomonadaceae bacterium]
MSLPLIFGISVRSLGFARLANFVRGRRAANTQKMHNLFDARPEGASTLFDLQALSDSRPVRSLLNFAALLCVALCGASTVFAQARPGEVAAHEGGGEASLILPDLSSVTFLGLNGRTLLLIGLGVCFLGLMFGLAIYMQLKNLPVHRSMREISELIYETCRRTSSRRGASSSSS